MVHCPAYLDSLGDKASQSNIGNCRVPVLARISPKQPPIDISAGRADSSGRLFNVLISQLRYPKFYILSRHLIESRKCIKHGPD